MYTECPFCGSVYIVEINECALVDTDPRADLCDQTCHKYSENYTCSCGPGFDLDPITKTRCLGKSIYSRPILSA